MTDAENPEAVVPSGDSEDKRPQFGNRFLTDKEKVFEHNAWDNVEWDEELLSQAKEKVEKNLASFMTDERKGDLERLAADQWDKFYSIHDNRFFKDRNWLFTEFPELGKTVTVPDLPGDTTEGSSSSSMSSPQKQINILEVGCGAGNTVFPILQTNNSEDLFVFCCDFSQVAVDIVKNHEAYDEKRCEAFRWDLTDTENEAIPVKDGTIDCITMLFVLSAIDPSHFPRVIRRLSRLLRPGGRILFRDYGRFDMAQLRFKTGSAIADNFYARGDGTRVYFFTKEEARELFTSAGLEEEFNECDKRLQINRGRQLKMYRVWLQCKYRKPREN